MQISRKFLVIGVAGIILAGVGCKNETPAPETTPAVVTPTTTPTPTPAKATTAAPAVKKVTAPVTKTQQTAEKYTDAINSYGFQGARMQFANCSGYPSSISVKKGVKFMIDNRDSVKRVIGIGKTSYTLAPYAFQIISIATAGTYNVTCNGGGAAQLVVQN